MSNIYTDTNAPMNTLKPQPGQWGSYHPKFHPLPGDWAKKQMSEGYHMSAGTSKSSRPMTELQRALAAERQQHEYWEEWQGVRPGRAIYENPRELQNTLLPSAKYGTEGRGYG